MNILLAGGGTGGHIFPLLAVAESIREQQAESSCRFVCSTRPLDAEILTREGEAFDAIPARPFGLRPRTLVRFILGWGGAMRSARSIICAHSPRVIITSGGFVSAPVVQAARREHVPIVAVNLDAVAGKANRWIARHADVCVSTTVAEWDKVPAHWQRIAPIVRRSMRTSCDPKEARRALGLDPEMKTLLVTGGSQGAQSLNGEIAWMVRHHPEYFAGWQVLHQCGGDAEQTKMLRAVYERAEVPAVIVPFIDDMANAWAAADLAVSRAGAGAVAEVRASCTPTMFMPYPFHRDGHQRQNCAYLCNWEDAAVDCVEGGEVTWSLKSIEAEQAFMDIEDDFEPLLTSDGDRQSMRDNLKKLGPVDGADAVARIALERARKE